MMIEILDREIWNLKSIRSTLKEIDSVPDDILDFFTEIITRITEVHNEMCRIEAENR